MSYQWNESLYFTNNAKGKHRLLEQKNIADFIATLDFDKTNKKKSS
jgi:hypothetical protein